MFIRLLAAMAALAGVNGAMPRAEAKRVAREHGFGTHGAGGGIARELNLRGMPAYNEYRELLGTELTYRQNRNAAKRRRRALRAAAKRRTPPRAPAELRWSVDHAQGPDWTAVDEAR